MAVHNIPVADFNGPSTPASFDEFIARINADVGMTSVALDVHWKDYPGGADPSVDIEFTIALTAPEIVIVDALAAAVPGDDAPGIDTFLANYSADSYSGDFKDLGAATTASSAAFIDRLDESPVLAGGKYRIIITATTEGTLGNTETDVRVTIDGVIAETHASFGSNKYVYARDHVLAAGARDMLLQIARKSGGGQAEISESTIDYVWIGVA